MSKPSLVIVLAEDERHRRLMYRYLLRSSLRPHEMTIEMSPAGKGSAESWVRKTFAKQVAACRLRQSRARTALVVVIDADTHSIEERIAQLGQALHDEQRPPLTSTDHVACLIPKRNVETWILCLNGNAVNEETDYKDRNHRWDQLIRTAVESLYQWTRPNAALPQHCIDSLRTGIGELRRLAL